MDRTATVAKTPDGEKNVNHLRVPEFGVLDIRLEAGNKSSKCYRPKGSPDPQPKAEGGDDFHFIPEKETIELKYEIHDPYHTVEDATLELFSRFDDQPLWKLEIKKLGETWWAHGKHVVKWDGRIVEAAAEQKGTEKDGALQHDLAKIEPPKTSDALPDGFVTLEHTPYKLKLTLKSGDPKITGNPATGWTYFQLLLKSIELDLGPEEAVPAAAVDDERHKRDKAVRKQIVDDGGIPASDGTRKVVLISNLYKTAGGQMNDNTAYTVYETLWGDGPQIPIVAKIRMLDSSDEEVKLDEEVLGAVALGNAKFLWDWEDPDEDTARQGKADPKSFIVAAIDYYKDGTDTRSAGKDHTYPKGDDCHVDRGGKRGPDAKATFPAQAGYDAKNTLDAGKFPFKVEASTERKWAAFSRGWRKGKLRGQTGVVFQPSRMAGDDCKISVYLAYDKKAKDKLVLDVKDEPLRAPAAIKALTGKFQTWREIHLARYIRKTNAIAAFLPANLAGVRGFYNEPYIEVEDEMGGDQYLWSEHRDAAGAAIDYTALCKAEVDAAANLVQQSVSSTADHSSVDSCFLVKEYADAVQAIHLDLHTGVAAAAADFSEWATAAGGTAADLAKGLGADDLATAPAGDRKTRLQATKTLLVNNKMETGGRYARYLDKQLFSPIKRVARDSLKLIEGGKNGVGDAAKQGITVIHFNRSNTALRDAYAAGQNPGSKLGSAIDAADADRNRVVFLFVAPRLDTFVHEIGHHLFLPHTAAEGGPADRHDDRVPAVKTNPGDGDKICVMSYSRPREAFCGVCQLRLRGWDATQIDKTSANNKKP